MSSRAVVGTSSVTGLIVHLLHHLTSSPPPAAPLLDSVLPSCPVDFEGNIHLPSLVIGVLIGLAFWPLFEFLFLLRTALLRCVARRLSAGHAGFYRLL